MPDHRGLTDAYVEDCPWLGQIPETWVTVPLRAYLRKKRQLVGPKHPEYQLLSLTKRGVIVRDLTQMKGKFPSSFESYQVLNPGDFVFCLFDVQETPRTVGLSRHQGMITGAYDAYTCSDPMDARFIAKQLMSFDDQKSLRPLYRGLRNTLPRERFEGLRIAMPPAEERKLIVRYLDNAEIRIQRALRSKEHLIARLTEYREAIILQTLLSGGAVPLFPGSDYLLPEHWETVPFWSAAKERKATNRTTLQLLSVYLDRGVILYGEGGGQVHKPSKDLSKYQEVQPGDLVLNNQQAWRGSVGVSPHHGIVSPAYVVCDLDPGLHPEWSNFLFRSRIMVDQFGLSSRGVGSIQRQIHMPSLRLARVPIPPMSEQIRMSDEITSRTQQVDMSLASTRDEVRLLHEYRTRLISDVVTGRKDIRKEAEAMKDVDPDELQALYTSTTSAEGETEPDDE